MDKIIKIKVETNEIDTQQQLGKLQQPKAGSLG